jgi:Holliday junction resolvase
MIIVWTHLYPKKEKDHPKPNLAREKAQPLLESRIKDIRAEYKRIEQDLQSQLDEQSRCFEGRTKINRTCWDCGVASTLCVEYDGIRPYATGQCYQCGRPMWMGVNIKVGMYPNEIRDALFTKDQVGVKHLLDFMLSNGMPDLKMKYVGRSIEKTYSGREVAARNAKRDEAILAEIMRPIYNVQTEVHLGFKVDGDSREHVCHPDVVAGCDDTVFILEMKISSGEIKPEQLLKYQQCFKAFIGTKKNVRAVATVAVVWEKDRGEEAHCITLAELLPVRDFEDMHPLLLKHATHISRWTGESYIDER